MMATEMSKEKAKITEVFSSKQHLTAWAWIVPYLLYHVRESPGWTGGKQAEKEPKAETMWKRRSERSAKWALKDLLGGVREKTRSERKLAAKSRQSVDGNRTTVGFQTE